MGTLLRDLAEGGASLARDEVRLARIELGQMAVGIGKGTALVAGGVVLGLLGAIALLTGIVLLIGDQWLPADRYWVAALGILIITGGLAAWLAKRGLSALSPSELAPHETVATLKEDTQWLKRRLT